MAEEAAEAIATAAEEVITAAGATADNKVGGCKCTRPSYFSYEIEIGNPYAILFTARAMRETFLAEVFL